MPIECSKKIVRKSQNEFHAVDNVIMKFAFNIHNKFGRFCDEMIYNKMLNNYCNKNKLNASSEVAIKVSYKDFYKLYYLDLLVENGIIYELKTVEALNNLHEQQLINYLLLTGLNHGKLINFRTASVEKRFCSNGFKDDSRKNYYIDSTQWDDNIAKSKLCKNIIRELLDEWGAFLDFNLYREAMIYFLGGKNNVVRLIDIIDDDNNVIAQQKLTLFNECTAFHVSGISQYCQSYVDHMLRLLEHTNLKAIQWINFNKDEIQLMTIKE
jgi:GxxExxY protein